MSTGKCAAQVPPIPVHRPESLITSSHSNFINVNIHLALSQVRLASLVSPAPYQSFQVKIRVPSLSPLTPACPASNRPPYTPHATDRRHLELCVWASRLSSGAIVLSTRKGEVGGVLDILSIISFPTRMPPDLVASDHGVLIASTACKDIGCRGQSSSVHLPTPTCLSAASFCFVGRPKQLPGPNHRQCLLRNRHCCPLQQSFGVWFAAAQTPDKNACSLQIPPSRSSLGSYSRLDS